MRLLSHVTQRWVTQRLVQSPIFNQFVHRTSSLFSDKTVHFSVPRAPARRAVPPRGTQAAEAPREDAGLSTLRHRAAAFARALREEARKDVEGISKPRR